MLGDLIYEAKGMVVGYRVLNTEDLRVEVRNFEGRNRNPPIQ
jgi:hypothetical protein